MNEKLELLTPGSQWTTPRQRIVTFLMTTNGNMPEAYVAQQGQHVVARTEKGNIISMDIDSFLRKHEFFNVSPEYEFLLNRLLTGEVFDLGEVGTDDSADTEQDSELDVEALLDSDGDSGEMEDLQPIEPVGVTFYHDGDQTPLLTQGDLDQLLMHVASEPVIDNTCRLAGTRHVLTFRCDDENLHKLLVAAFDPNASRRGNAYGSMSYETPIGTKHVTWDAFVAATEGRGLNGAQFLNISVLETQNYLGSDGQQELFDTDPVEETEQERLARLAASLDSDADNDVEDVELNETTTGMKPVEAVEPETAPAPAGFGTVKPASQP